MGYYPDVISGNKFKPIAELENALRHKMNGLNGFMRGGSSGGGIQNLRVSVFNFTKETLKGNTAVSFSSDETGFDITNDPVIPVCKYRSGSNRWGVLTSDLSPNEFGTCIVTGVAVVRSGFNTEYLSPVDGGEFQFGTEVRNLYNSKGYSIILLGNGPGRYNGYFTIKLRVLPNGTKKLVVCDGQTYDDTKGTSGNSLAYVGVSPFLVPYYEVDIAKIESQKNVVAEFTPPEYDKDGNVTKEGYVSIAFCKSLDNYYGGSESPTDNGRERFFSLIGEISIKDGDVQITQRHGTAYADDFRQAQFAYFNGALSIAYWVRCYQ